MTNVERHPHMPKTWIGYAHGAWRIRKTGYGYTAVKNDLTAVIVKPLLREINRELQRRNAV